MGTTMQWNLPADAGKVEYTQPVIGGDDVHGLRMSNAAGPWIGEQLLILGTVPELLAWYEKVGEAVAALPDPEPRCELADIPVHDGLDDEPEGGSWTR